MYIATKTDFKGSKSTETRSRDGITAWLCEKLPTLALNKIVFMIYQCWDFCKTCFSAFYCFYPTKAIHQSKKSGSIWWLNPSAW